MKIFDLHSDLGYNCMHEENALDKRLKEMEEGEIAIVGFANYFNGSEDWDYMQKMILNSKKEISEHKLKFIKNSDDFNHLDKISCIITVEGMCGIKDNTEEKIQWLYDQGIRLATLTWNEENTLATGSKGTVTRGLSAEGIKAIKKMDELGMIVDVSHANDKTFWDIIGVSTKPIIASHSNVRNLCGHDRNLSDQMIKAIASKGGIIGLNSYINFIGKDGNANSLAEHALYMKNLVGIDHIACGFDFMNYFPDHPKQNDLYKSSDAQNLVKALEAHGFSEEEIYKICYLNSYSFFKQNLT